jgi:hypothetical protein
MGSIFISCERISGACILDFFKFGPEIFEWLNFKKSLPHLKAHKKFLGLNVKN